MESICKCKKLKCTRHGNCQSCREFHNAKNSLPACERDLNRAKLREQHRIERREARKK